MKASKLLLPIFTLFLVLFAFSCDRAEDDEQPVDLNDQTRNSGLVARYAVNGNNLSLLRSGPAATGFFNQARQNEFWDFFTNLIPVEARSVMKEMELFADTEDGTAAYVSAIDQNDLSVWEMGHNLDFVWDRNNQFVPGETAYTSIHEVAHLLTLDHTQVNVTNGGCNNFFTGEGCSTAASYINQFYNNFWSDIFEENQRIREDDFDGYYQFYQKYRSRFVSEYAATNPGEDIAESFATYVMGDPPTGTSIAAQKVRFFDDFPELVTLKNQIKANINFDVNLGNIQGERSKRFTSQTEAKPKF
ncbi:hypothetical protein [Roseivirga misakiensis]|uniref:Peptidase M12A domain-containing protein n=1 Tax=Roseivirga misakiensis TaxID=1563681 RepID=A0A1E5T1M2_9BACT|nr:hypothetical protein [Roseivirga misakiensis]OEK05278.1 hypothetical protein BFP71_17920 [Roseivirga misakiensis]